MLLFKIHIKYQINTFNTFLLHSTSLFPINIPNVYLKYPKYYTNTRWQKYQLSILHIPEIPKKPHKYHLKKYPINDISTSWHIILFYFLWLKQPSFTYYIYDHFTVFLLSVLCIFARYLVLFCLFSFSIFAANKPNRNFSTLECQTRQETQNENQVQLKVEQIFDIDNDYAHPQEQLNIQISHVEHNRGKGEGKGGWLWGRLNIVYGSSRGHKLTDSIIGTTTATTAKTLAAGHVESSFSRKFFVFFFLVYLSGVFLVLWPTGMGHE